MDGLHTQVSFERLLANDSMLHSQSTICGDRTAAERPSVIQSILLSERSVAGPCDDEEDGVYL